MKERTVLITGGTGLLGKGMEETSHPGFKIVSLHMRDYRVEDANADHLILDIGDSRKVNELFRRHEFDAVVHAAGIASVDYVEKHPEESRKSNVAGTRNVVEAAKKAGCYFIHISTNAVFDGEKAPYRETDPVRPINKYGQIKVECERLVAETLKNFSIVRPILMYGWNHVVCRPNPATWIFDKLMRGEAVQLVNDVFENPLYNLQCGEALWRIVEKKPSDVFHVAGGEVVNRYRFALKLADVFGLDRSLVQEVDSSFFRSIAPRPKNTSFVTTRMERELGVRALSVEEGLRHMKAHMGIKA